MNIWNFKGPVPLSEKIVVSGVLLNMPIGSAGWFDPENGSPVLLHREEDPEGPWFWISEGDTQREVFTLLEALSLLGVQ